MKKLNQNIQNMGLFRSLGILFLIGLVIGTVFANVFRSYYIQDLLQYNTYYIDNIANIKIDKFEILKIALVNNLKEYMLTWILCITILGIPYILWRTLYKGFLVGFLISTATMRYGLMGIFLFCVYIIPQYIVYIPVLALTYTKGFSLCKKLYFQNTVPQVSKRKIIMEYLPYLLIIFILLVLGSFLEAYINTELIKKTLANI